MSILIALLLDWFLGEPPVQIHPVVGMGHALKRAETLQRLKQPFLWGSLCFLLGAIVFFSAAFVVQIQLHRLPMLFEILSTAILLKPTFAFRMLLAEVRAVELALQESLEQGQKRLSYIVSRETKNLDPTQVRESALESLSENLSDSVIAPLFWFVLLGLPGAYLYRFVNTADAMWGYRTEQYEWWGKIAAYTDDLLNWFPARLTGLALLWPFCVSIERLSQEAQKTPSPNSGWSMAALALHLGIRLGKPGVYTLNPQGTAPDNESVMGGITWVKVVGWTLTLVLAALGFGFHGI
jgi:adenosylcobinamide-phosphate synthase